MGFVGHGTDWLNDNCEEDKKTYSGEMRETVYRIPRQSQGDGLQDPRLLSSPLPLPPQTGTTLTTTPGSRGSASWETSDKIYCSALSNVSKGTLVQLIKCSVSRLSCLLAIESSRLVWLFTDSKAARNQTTDVSGNPEGDVIQVGETASSPCQQTQPGVKVRVPATREELKDTGRAPN